MILRANGYRLFSGLIFVGGCSLGVAGALSNEQGTRVWWSVLAAICAVFVARAWRLGVVIGGDRLVIRSWWRSYEIPLDQIVRVSRAQYSGAWMRNSALLDWWDQLIIETVAGSTIEVTPIVGWDSRSGDGTVARKMRELDLLVAQQRAMPQEDPWPFTEQGDSQIQPSAYAFSSASTYGGWTLSREQDGTTVWTSPTGHGYRVPSATYPVDETMKIKKDAAEDGPKSEDGRSDADRGQLRAICAGPCQVQLELIPVVDEEFGNPRLAALYDVLDPDRSDLLAYVEIVSELGGERVLDVGCGTGTLALMLADCGLDVIGLDPAGASLVVARGKPGAGRVRWVEGEVGAR